MSFAPRSASSNARHIPGYRTHPPASARPDACCFRSLVITSTTGPTTTQESFACTRSGTRLAVGGPRARSEPKGRVERMNKTLQDRLVKELRLRGISTMEVGNAFLAEFMEDYNRRFERTPKNSHDAHRPLHGDEDLSRIFTWQEERTMSRNLVVHFKRVSYLVEPAPRLCPSRASASASSSGTTGESRSGARTDCFPMRRPVRGRGEQAARRGHPGFAEGAGQGAPCVEETHSSRERPHRGCSHRGRDIGAGATPVADGLGEVASFIARIEAEQRARQKAHNDRAALRRKAALALGQRPA